jgi:hypothetical protein
MLLVTEKALDGVTLPLVRDAIDNAIRERRPLVVYAEAERLLVAHPELRVPVDQLAEDIIRFAAYAGAPIEVG